MVEKYNLESGKWMQTVYNNQWSLNPGKTIILMKNII